MNADAWTVVGWRTSSYSANGNARCVEVGWQVSTYSPDGGKSCVEARLVLDGSSRSAVRDSTQRERGFLSFGHTEWAAFLRSVKQGRL